MTNELRAKFEVWWSVSMRQSIARTGDYYFDPETRLAWKAYQADHASRDAEVEALEKRVGNVVRQMKDCASDISQTPSLTGQWVADTINWFADEIGIDAAMREGE